MYGLFFLSANPNITLTMAPPYSGLVMAGFNPNPFPVALYPRCRDSDLRHLFSNLPQCLGPARPGHPGDIEVLTKQYFVYILASRRNGAPYVGVTIDREDESEPG